MFNFHNLKSPSFEIAKDYYSYLDFRRMTLYAKSRSRAEAVFIFLSIVALLLFWIFEGFKYLDQFLRSFNSYYAIEGTLYILIILTFFVLLKLFYETYLNFYLDKKYRISRMKITEFLKSKSKQFTIYLIAAILIILPLFLFNYLFGTHFWWRLWITASIVIVLYDFLYPFIYLYLLNSVNNEVIPELRNKILDFCNSIDFPISNIHIFESSKRTIRLNAFFAGFGKSKSIILNDNIIENFSDDEILAVIGHEAGHYKLKHNIYNIAFTILLLGLILFLYSLLISDFEIFKSFYVYNISFHVGIVLYSILLSPLFILIAPFVNYHLRKFETQADKFSFTYNGNKDALISAIKKIYMINVFNPVPHPYYVFFYYQRNPAPQRIRNIENF